MTNPCFITDTTAVALKSDVIAAISDGCSDLTIYNFTTTTLPSNFGSGISTLKFLTALRLSDGVLAASAFSAANLSDLLTLDLTGITSIPNFASSLFRSATMNQLTSLLFRSDLPSLPTSAFQSAQMSDLPILDLRPIKTLPNASIFQSAIMNKLTSLLFRSDLPNLGASAFESAQMNALTTLDLSPIKTLSDASIFKFASMNSLTSLIFRSNLPTSAFSAAQMNALTTLDLRPIETLTNISVFNGAQMNALTSILFRSDFPSLPELIFSNASMNALNTLDLRNIKTLPNQQPFSGAFMNGVTTLLFPSDLPSLPLGAFQIAQMNALISLDLRNIQAFPDTSTSIFSQTKMNSITSLLFRSDTLSLPSSMFNSAQMNALTTLDLRSIQTWPSGSQAVFKEAQMNSVTSLLFRNDLPPGTIFLPNQTFQNAQFGSLRGICLSPGIFFASSAFSVDTGPSDLTTLTNKNDSNLIYANGFYGYACDPIVFNGVTNTPFNILTSNPSVYKNNGGSNVGSLKITFVSDISTFPVTISNLQIKSDGTITSTAAGTYQFTMRLTGAGSRIGARFVQINITSGPVCSVSVSDFKATPAVNCVGTPFTVSWKSLTVNGSDRHTAIITFNGSDFVSDYLNTGGSKVLTAPNTASDYIVKLKIVDKANSDCSDIKNITVKVDKITASNFNGGPACVNSFFDVFFDLSVQNGGNARTTLTFNGSDYKSDFTSGTNRSFHIQAPAIASDYPVTLKVQDTLNLACSDMKTAVIKVDKITASDLHGGPVCVDSFFDVFFDVTVQNGGNAHTTLTFNGSDYVSDFANGTHSFNVQAPSIGSDYIATLKVQDTINLACSDIKTSPIKVVKAKISDIQLTQNPVCKDLPYTASWQVDAQNGGTTANVNINVNGVNYPSVQPIAGGSVNLPAIGTESDYVVTLTIVDSSYPMCSDVKSTTLHVAAVAVNAGPDREIVYGQSTVLGMGSAAPNVDYLWSPGGMTTLTPTIAPPPGYTTYTVIASRTDVSDCIASDSVTVFACHIQLSDIQFTSLGQTAFTLSGNQFSNKSGTRCVDITYLGQTHHQTFLGDSEFIDGFSGITVVDGAPITIHAYDSDNPACSDVVTVISHIEGTQGILGFKLEGSLLAFDLALTPEATLAMMPVTSDIHVAIQRLCDFTETQFCQRTLAALTITNQSDVFSDSHIITQGTHHVFVTCSDLVINFDEIHGLFHMDISPFNANNTIVHYSDAFDSFSQNMVFTGTGFSLSFNNEKFVSINPCISDNPHIAITDFVDCTLFCADIDSPVTDVDEVECIPLCYNRTSDASYVCQLIHCEEQVEKYLSDHFDGYMFSSDKCCVTYTGGIVSNDLRIDLDACLMMFTRNYMPACSDTVLC